VITRILGKGRLSINFLGVKIAQNGHDMYRGNRSITLMLHTRISLGKTSEDPRYTPLAGLWVPCK
jgi:hypothetical protein